MKRASLGVAVTVLGLFAAACRDPLTPSIPLDELLAAPLAVEIAGRSYVLETEIWRDFMPPAEPGGSTLFVVVYLTAVDSLPFPDEIDATRLWVIHGDEVWETDFAGESRPRDPARLDQLQKNAAGGPRWDIGDEVEVVVRVTASAGAPRLLRAARQKIGMTV